jgi:hypothetical protein
LISGINVNSTIIEQYMVIRTEAENVASHVRPARHIDGLGAIPAATDARLVVPVDASVEKMSPGL